MTVTLAINCLSDKHHFAKRVNYDDDMDTKTRSAVARNIQRLMEAQKPDGWKQEKLAERSGVAQRTISNILNPDTGISPTLDSLEKIARAFHLPTWIIQVPDIPVEILLSRRVEKLVTSYLQANDEGRAIIERTAEAELRYALTAAPGVRRIP
jgi:transcriptional regulator with XRE-family HTH domain